MKKYSFTLILTGVDDLTDEVANALFGAGCDDATPSMRSGVVRLGFDREDKTLKDAILSAIRDVKKASIGADVRRIDVEAFVTQSSIARRIGRSRQIVGQYVSGKRGPGGFPPPIYHVLDKSPLWEWSQVARWLQQNDMLAEDDLHEAQQAAFINSALEFRQYKREIDSQIVDEVMQTVGS